MPAIIETTELISKTMDSLIDFIVKDEPLGREFENYLIKNKIEIKNIVSETFPNILQKRESK